MPRYGAGNDAEIITVPNGLESSTWWPGRTHGRRFAQRRGARLLRVEQSKNWGKKWVFGEHRVAGTAQQRRGRTWGSERAPGSCGGNPSFTPSPLEEGTSIPGAAPWRWDPTSPLPCSPGRSQPKPLLRRGNRQGQLLAAGFPREPWLK